MNLVLTLRFGVKSDAMDKVQFVSLGVYWEMWERGARESVGRREGGGEIEGGGGGGRGRR